jgi:hypothetical protein
MRRGREASRDKRITLGVDVAVSLGGLITWNIGRFFCGHRSGSSFLLQGGDAIELVAGTPLVGITFMPVMNRRWMWHISGSYLAYAGADCTAHSGKPRADCWRRGCNMLVSVTKYLTQRQRGGSLSIG